MLKEKTIITLLIRRDDSLTEYMGVRNDLPGHNGSGNVSRSIRVIESMRENHVDTLANNSGHCLLAPPVAARTHKL